MNHKQLAAKAAKRVAVSKRPKQTIKTLLKHIKAYLGGKAV